jgi:effector-binding domain-containing protein
MLDQPEIVQTGTQLAAIIRFTIPRTEIKTVMGPGMAELMKTVAAQGIAPLGPIFSHHFRMDPEVFDFEVGVPIGTSVTPAGRVQLGELPATTVARTVYHGSYEGLGDAWGEFDAWIAREGLEPAADRWERYLAGPESSPDPANWRTELSRPLGG